MITKDLVRIGFKPIPHYTITNSHIYKLGRNRELSVGNVGTPNEIMAISQTDDKDERKITDLIILHNYDYDGYLSEEKLLTLINILK